MKIYSFNVKFHFYRNIFYGSTTQLLFSIYDEPPFVVSFFYEWGCFIIVRFLWFSSFEVMGAYCCYWAIFLHSAAHDLQALAHCRQWGSVKWAQSLAHASQIDAQREHSWLAFWLPRAIYCADIVQISIQSRSILIQWDLTLTSASCRHKDKHSSQACMQPLQASIQVCILFGAFNTVGMGYPS